MAPPYSMSVAAGLPQRTVQPRQPDAEQRECGRSGQGGQQGGKEGGMTARREGPGMPGRAGMARPGLGRMSARLRRRRLRAYRVMGRRVVRACG